jgi:hypothetical protein
MKKEKTEYTGLLGIVKQEENKWDLSMKANKFFPSFAPSQKDVIELVDLYWVDKFKDSDTDSLGTKKMFYNVIESPTLTASKMIDLDTKDIKIQAEDGQSVLPAMFYERELNVYMKSKKNAEGQTFGQFLNTLVMNYPKYGHLVVKKAKGSVHLVPLGNIINNQYAKSILKARYVIEKHEVTPEQFEYEAEVNGWDNIDFVLEKNKDKELITYYELSGEVKGETDNYFILAEGTSDGVTLFQDKRERKDLYKELKWDDIVGRALGRGIPEKLFEAQIHRNKIANYKSHGLHWTSKHIYQSQDPKLNRNLMTNVDDGEIMIVQKNIEPIVNEERNLAAYREEEIQLDALIEKRTFSYDAIRGQSAISGTPYSSLALNTQMAAGYFDVKREDLGMFIKEILWDWIIPDFKKTVNKKHELLMGEFDESNLDTLRELVIKNRTNKKVLEMVNKKGYLPTTAEYEQIKELVTEEIHQAKSWEIPDNFYENLQYKIRLDITGESVDTSAKLAALQTIMQIWGSNPAVLQDKFGRALITNTMDLMGLDTGLIPSEVPVEQPLPVGGSIAAPRQSTVQMTPTKQSIQ